MRVQWGILGTARTNRRFLAAARASACAGVLGIASRDVHRARVAAVAHRIDRAYGSYDALLADEDIEAVYISLPNALHLEWSLRALSAGKHVLCEKPLGADPLAVDEAFDAADRAGRKLFEGMMYRQHPQTHRLVELVRGGAVGAPLALRSVFGFPIADPENIRLSKPLDGGALMDVGCYCVDISCLVAGEPTAVSGMQVIGATGVDVRYAGSLGFGAGGVVAEFLVGLDLPRRMGFEVIGEEGSLLLRDPWHCRAPGIERRRDDRVEHVDVAAGDPYLLQLEGACAAIGGEPHSQGRADAVRQARILERLRGCAQSA